ncbi:glycosyltransferase family 4 protein [Chryseobacterium taihuense]|uniref:Glycosyltransferase involved in cell wall bisynthesis n=1 Tax=Chryseobacterium taihuense TaxID=1141221 RepID=A0ABY0QTK8_9FLAO|nr:glycosyltransferase family 4 protein [Chryseobacterium taihuense]SDL86360.1 Glycosyltransferase involved in cell wall bisynthesis [Chryseobacterium taihuense]
MINKVNKIFQFVQYLTIILYFKIRNGKNIFIFPFYHTGGAEKVHLDIVKSFPRKDNLVIFTNTSYNDHFLSEFKKHSKILQLYRYYDNLYFRKATFKFLRQLKNSSEITVFGCNSLYFYQVLEHLPKNVKKIDLLHAFTLPDLGGMEIYSLNKISFLTYRMVINEKTRNDLINLYKEKKIKEEYIRQIKIISIAIDLPKRKPIKNYQKEKLQIIYCGRIAKEKRVHLIIEIGKKLQNFTDLKIYGHQEIKIEGIDHFYQNNITDSKKLLSIYQHSDILLITSYREGFPVVIKEAMANGVVCISTDVGSISEHVINNVTGYTVQNNDNEELIIESFVEIIRNLFLDRELLSKISKNAYCHATQKFDLNLFKEEVNKLFKS